MSKHVRMALMLLVVCTAAVLAGDAEIALGAAIAFGLVALNSVYEERYL